MCWKFVPGAFERRRWRRGLRWHRGCLWWRCRHKARAAIDAIVPEGAVHRASAAEAAGILPVPGGLGAGAAVVAHTITRQGRVGTEGMVHTLAVVGAELNHARRGIG